MPNKNQLLLELLPLLQQKSSTPLPPALTEAEHRDRSDLVPQIPPKLARYAQPPEGSVALAPHRLPVPDRRPPYLGITAIASGAIVFCTFLVVSNLPNATAARQSEAFAAYAIEQSRQQSRPNNICISFVCPPAGESSATPVAQATAAPDPYAIAKAQWEQSLQGLSIAQLQQVKSTGGGCVGDVSCKALWDVLAAKGV